MLIRLAPEGSKGAKGRGVGSDAVEEGEGPAGCARDSGPLALSNFLRSDELEIHLRNQPRPRRSQRACPASLRTLRNPLFPIADNIW